MEQPFDIARLLALRALTTALAEQLASQARDYLANLAPLLSPRSLLGELIRGEKASVRGAEAAFQELARLYQPIARVQALNLQPDLRAPLDLFGITPEIFPASYSFTPEGSSRPLTIVTPLKWVLVYRDVGPQRLRELIASHPRSGGTDLQDCVLHYLVMHLLTSRRPGIAPVLQALRFPVSSARAEELAGLPITYLSAPLSTIRPPDAVILQSAQISGTNAFEEVVDLTDIARLADPLKERVLALVREHGAALLPELGAA
jgi:hypothetical protein